MVITRHNSHGRHHARTAGDIKTGNNASGGPVPMFYQRVVSAAIRGLTNRPNVICRHDADTIEEVVAVGRVRTRHNGPACAVPMFNHRAVSAQLLIVGRADRPDIIVSHGRDREQGIGLRSRIWTRDNLPIGGEDCVGNGQSEQHESGCASNFHVSLFLAQRDTAPTLCHNDFSVTALLRRPWPPSDRRSSEPG